MYLKTDNPFSLNNNEEPNVSTSLALRRCLLLQEVGQVSESHEVCFKLNPRRNIVEFSLSLNEIQQAKNLTPVFIHNFV